MGRDQIYWTPSGVHLYCIVSCKCVLAGSLIIHGKFREDLIMYSEVITNSHFIQPQLHSSRGGIIKVLKVFRENLSGIWRTCLKPYIKRSHFPLPTGGALTITLNVVIVSWNRVGWTGNDRLSDRFYLKWKQ